MRCSRATLPLYATKQVSLLGFADEPTRRALRKMGDGKAKQKTKVETWELKATSRASDSGASSKRTSQLLDAGDTRGVDTRQGLMGWGRGRATVKPLSLPATAAKAAAPLALCSSVAVAVHLPPLVPWHIPGHRLRAKGATRPPLLSPRRRPRRACAGGRATGAVPPAFPRSAHSHGHPFLTCRTIGHMSREQHPPPAFAPRAAALRQHTWPFRWQCAPGMLLQPGAHLHSRQNSSRLPPVRKPSA